MSEFKKGQIVYTSDHGKAWFISHYAGVNKTIGTEFPHLANVNYDKAIKGEGEGVGFRMCVSVEDYHKMLAQPKDKDLVWAWNGYSASVRVAFFYDGVNGRLYKGNGQRYSFSFDSYEVIPRDQWPRWAIEAYELLED